MQVPHFLDSAQKTLFFRGRAVFPFLPGNMSSLPEKYFPGLRLHGFRPFFFPSSGKCQRHQKLLSFLHFIGKKKKWVGFLLCFQGFFIDMEGYNGQKNGKIPGMAVFFI